MQYGVLAFFTGALLPGPVLSQTPDLVWPAPPEQARIRYITSISGERDVASERSFLGKIWDFIIGAEDVDYSLVQPVGVCADNAGRIYVSDPGARCIHMFDPENEDYEQILDGDGYALRSPIDLAISPAGVLFVSDSDLKKVIAYDEDLDVEFSIEGMFERPTGLTIFKSKLYVVDTGLHKIFVFDLTGKPLFDFGTRGTSEGEFNYPVFIAAGRQLCVVDAMNFRVQIFDDTGRALGGFGSQGGEMGSFANPKGVAVDSEGHIYVADAMFDAFQIFDGKGSLLLVVGGSGSGPGEFYNPSGMFVDGQDKIYVVDALNRRVQIFQYLGS